MCARSSPLRLRTEGKLTMKHVIWNLCHLLNIKQFFDISLNFIRQLRFKLRVVEGRTHVV